MRVTLAICLISATFVVAQENRLTFEVASIRPTKPDGSGPSIIPMSAGQGYEAESAPVRLMISVMYRIPIANVRGGPSWLDSELWNVEAKADHAYGLDDLHKMFRHLLEDEFKLKFHKETKEGQVYALVVDKSGSKMKTNENPPDFETPIDGHLGGVAAGKRVSMEYLCYWLQQRLTNDGGRPVINKPGLTGYYDFKLTYMPELPPGFDKANMPPEMLDRPSLFDALRGQLGLKLEAQKGPVDYYVIDHVERPSGN
ncbi:MAG TPA: TIGR03435 family protein [Bryobacteraceae bacterium]|jgi:uncharacterized protein (TIGR03435 family)